MKPNLLRLIATLAGLGALVGGAVVMQRHRDVLLSPQQMQERGGEVLPALVVLVAGLIAVLGALLLRRHARPLVQLLLVVGALLLGGLTAEALILTRRPPPREQPVVRGPLVEVVVAERRDVPIRIMGHGTVQAKVRSRIVPQVDGRVTALHANMVSGGLVPAGEPLVEIDRTDYELALERARTELAQAEAAVRTAAARVDETEAQLDDARDDLERTQRLFETNVATQREVEKAEVAYRVASAHHRTARAEVDSAAGRVAAAKLDVRRAGIDLDRTRITLPFDAVVLNEQVDVGQYLTSGQSIGEVYGTEAVEIPVPLEDRELQWLAAAPLAGRIESAGPAESAAGGPAADVRAEFGGRLCEWPGRVVRIEGQVDPRSRMISVVVRVDDPLGGGSVARPTTTSGGGPPARTSGGARPPLMPGTFVDVAIHGRTLRDVIPLPRHALHDGDEVWVVEDGRLRIRSVQVARRDRREVHVASGLGDGALVIVSPMDAVTDGMKVRIPQEAELARAGGGGAGESRRAGSRP